MRSVCICVRRGGALLTLLAVLAAPIARANDGDDPHARVSPPIGAASTHQEPPGFFAWLLSWMQ